MLREQVEVSIVKSYPRASCAYRAVCTGMGWNPSEMYDWVEGKMAVGTCRWPDMRSSPEDEKRMDSR
jgi:hypothetical protein